MVVCIAGKNDIAIEIVKFLKDNYSEIELVGITNKSDIGVNGYFRSYKWFLNFNNIPQITQEEVYTVKDLLFISLEFDSIINPSNFSSNRLYNIHFSLLPAYKGMYTSAWPVLNCENYSGVTLHEIDRGIDTGDIIDQIKFKLDNAETVKSLYQKYMDYGIELMKRNIPVLFSNNYNKTIQPSKGSTYYSKNSIDYKNLRISLNVTAERLDAQIRAFTYREYQIPVIAGHKIHKSEITSTKSTCKPGHIVNEDEFSILISTIDYDVILYKDRFEEFIKACETDDLETVERLHDYVNLEERTNEGWTPLIVAVYNNSIKTADYLITKGANINAVNFKGTSVVMYAKDAALNSGDYTVLDTVLKNKPDIYHKDFCNKNIFDYLQDQTSEIGQYIKDRINDKIPGLTEN
jgi:methionyl-tRNA formyltransferase